MRNQLSAFRSILTEQDKGKAFDGAIIRIPLRRADRVGQTGIVPEGKGTTPADVEDVFREFSGELVKSLLFLRNLNSITLKIGDKIIAQATSVFVGPSSPNDPSSASSSARKKQKKRNKHKEKDDINTAYTRVYVDKVEASAAKDFRMDISFQSEQYPPGKELKFEYAVSHTLQQGPDDAELQAWAVKNKLFAWTAIAAPLKVPHPILSTASGLGFTDIYVFVNNRGVPISKAVSSTHFHFQSLRTIQSTFTACSRSPAIV